MNSFTITEFIHAAIAGQAGSAHVYEVSTVSTAHAQIIQSHTGIDIDRFKHILDEGAVRHTLKRHGNPAEDAKSGQIAITPADFTLIPIIISEFDSVRYGGKNKIGREVIVFQKTIGDAYFYVAEVRTGRKRLAMQTMYKRKAPNQ
jgi:hypothetical protein